jgi:ureidoglycolate lyase
MTAIRLTPKALSRTEFADFGEIIETEGHEATKINYGQTRRYDSIARIDVTEYDGKPQLSIFRSKPVVLPFQLTVMEYHPLGSQTFMPLHNRPFLVLVAPPSTVLDPATIRAYISNGHQGVNYRKGTWHHYQLSLEQQCDYLVIDRSGPGNNCVECRLETELWIQPGL